MRDPSIHIRRSHLIGLMETLGLDTSKVNVLLERALKHSIRNRVVVVGKYNTKKSIERTAAVDINIVEDFNKIYDATLKDRGIKILTIKKTDPAYLTLKEIAKQAYDFCQLFELEYTEGFKIYIEVGLELMGRKFSTYRLKAYADRIVSSFENRLVVAQDEKSQETKKMYEAWKKVLLKYFQQDIKITVADKYVNFVYARQDADQIGADYEDWMTAQFEKWAFANIIPEFTQLHGENAALNYQTYIAQKKKEYDSDTERRHFKTLSDKKIVLKKNQRAGRRGQKGV